MFAAVLVFAGVSAGGAAPVPWGVTAEVVEQRPGWQCSQMATYTRALEERIGLAWTWAHLRARAEDDRAWEAWKTTVAVELEICPTVHTLPAETSVDCLKPYSTRLVLSSGAATIDDSVDKAIVVSGEQPLPAGEGCRRNYLRVMVRFAPSTLNQGALLDALMTRLADPDPAIRALAVAALGVMGDAAWPAVCRLVEMTRDADARVRVTARGAVTRIIGADRSSLVWP